MDSCCVCGKQRTANRRIIRIKGGWVCVECVNASTLMSEYPDARQREKALSGMDKATVTDSVNRGRAESEKKQRELEERQQAQEARLDSIPVTTMDIQKPYEIVGPLFFQTSNKGIFSSSYDRLEKQYRSELEQRRREGQFSPTFADWGFLFGMGWGVGQNKFDPAFYIAVQELKKRAISVGADGIVGLRMDLDLDTNGFEYFYLQMYGTAVKFL